MNILKKMSIAILGMLMLSAPAIAKEIDKISTEDLKMRNMAMVETTISQQLKADVSAVNAEGANAWTKIMYRGKAAYVFGDSSLVQFLDGVVQIYDAPKYGISTVNCLNVRTDADEGAKVVRRLYNGCKLEIVGECGDFYAVQNEENIQFVSKLYVEEITKEEYEKVSPGDNIITEAMQYIGTPYYYGGSSPAGFDCSGFVSYVYRQLGISLNRTAAGQMSNGYRVGLDELQRGDLVFFGSGGYIDHVGIYVGNGNMIHAPYSGRSVCVESIYSGYFGSRLVGARRIF